MHTHQPEEARTPVVSVVVPCYKQAVYLPEALDSVLAQTFGQWEAIVVDDGSPDHTRDVALAYQARDSRIRYLKLENGGPARARNQGIAHARGEFILPLDADDRISPDYLAEALQAFRERPQLRVVYCQAEFYIYAKHRDLYARHFDECVLTPLRKQERLCALVSRYARTWPARLMRKWMRRQPWWADVEWLFAR